MRFHHIHNLNPTGCSAARFADVDESLPDRAEAMVAVKASLSRHHKRLSKLWSAADEASFRACLATLHRCTANKLVSASSEDPGEISVEQIREAVTRREVSFEYQPIFDISTKKITSAEALIRWRKSGRNVSPDEFIIIAEQSELIHSVTCAAISSVSRDLGPWLRVHRDFCISINIVSEDVGTPLFHNCLRDQIERHGIFPSQIAFEITERQQVRLADTIAEISKLSNKGYKIYIDDFGRGYSNISYLSEFAIDAIKIDRSFTSSIVKRNRRRRLFEMIVAMAQAMEIEVIVEGVETELQATFCKAHSIEFLQGLYVSKPVVAADLMKMVDEDRAYHLNV